MTEKSIFPVGDHFPRPYDANFLRPGNARKIDDSSGGPLSETYDAKLLRPGNGRKINFSGGGPLSETLNF